MPDKLKNIKKILIVEDETPLREVLVKELNEEGYKAVPAENGQAGIDALKKAKGDFDLILLDIVMPNMDGFLTLENMRQEGFDVPTVILSNISQSEERTRAKKLGAVGYIVKSDTTLSGIMQFIKDLAK